MYFGLGKCMWHQNAMVKASGCWRRKRIRMLKGGVELALHPVMFHCLALPSR